MKNLILGMMMLAVISCNTGKIKEKKDFYSAGKIEFRTGEITRVRNFKIGRTVYSPKNKDLDFIEVPIVAVNVSDEDIQIPFAETVVSEKKTDSLKPKNGKDLVEYPTFMNGCCGFLEQMFDEFKIVSDPLFFKPIVKPQQSISRAAYFMYPKDKTPKFIQFAYSLPNSNKPVPIGPFEFKEK